MNSNQFQSQNCVGLAIFNTELYERDAGIEFKIWSEPSKVKVATIQPFQNIFLMCTPCCSCRFNRK